MRRRKATEHSFSKKPSLNPFIERVVVSGRRFVAWKYYERKRSEVKEANEAYLDSRPGLKKFADIARAFISMPLALPNERFDVQ